MLLCTLGASLLGNILAGKGINKKGQGIVRAGEGAAKSTKQSQGIVRAGYGHRSLNSSKNSKMDF